MKNKHRKPKRVQLNLENLETRHLMATVALYETGADGDSYQPILATVKSFGETINDIKDLSDSSIDSALANADVLIIPEAETQFLSTHAQQAIRTYVGAGKTVIAFHDEGGLLNPLFNLTLKFNDGVGTKTETKTNAANQTIFSGGATNLVSSDELNLLTLASLPAGSVSAYEDSNMSSIAIIPYNSGQLIYFAPEWSNMKPNGPDDGGWLDVFKTAIESNNNSNSVVIAAVTPNPRNTPVDSIPVTFKNAIDANTFTVDDLSLTRDGTNVPLDAAVNIQKVDSTHYTISGLTTITSAPGSYVLTINAVTINDSTGTALKGTPHASWSVDTTAPTVTDVIDVTPDPRSGNNKGVNAIDFILSEAIDPTTLDFNDLTLTRDGGANLITASVTIAPVAGKTNQYRASGLTALTNVSGNYTFTVSGYAIKDLAGNTGTGSASDSWVANDPAVISMGGNIVYREGSAPLPLAAFATVTDADTPAFDQGKLTVTIAVNVAATDKLSIISRGKGTGQIFVNPDNSILYSGTLIGQASGGTAGAPLIVALNANATAAATQALVTSVAFSSPEDFPLPATRRVNFVLEDGEGGTSRVAFKTISIVPVNNAPKLTVDATANYTLNSTAVLLAPNAKLVDNDSPIFNTGSLRVSIKTNGDKKEKLEIGGAFTVNGLDVTYGGKVVGNLATGGGSGGKDLFIRFNLNSTRDVVEQLVKSITFRTVGSSSSLNRHLSFLLRDNAGGTVETFTDVNLGA